MNDIISRILKVFRVYCNLRKINADPCLSSMWKGDIEILMDTEELMALENEFGITIDEETASEIYELNISEVAVVIEKLIGEQNKKDYKSESIIEALSPEDAKNVLLTIWKENIQGRYYIREGIVRFQFENKK